MKGLTNDPAPRNTLNMNLSVQDCNTGNLYVTRMRKVYVQGA